MMLGGPRQEANPGSCGDGRTLYHFAIVTAFMKFEVMKSWIPATITNLKFTQP